MPVRISKNEAAYKLSSERLASTDDCFSVYAELPVPVNISDVELVEFPYDTNNCIPTPEDVIELIQRKYVAAAIELTAIMKIDKRHIMIPDRTIISRTVEPIKQKSEYTKYVDDMDVWFDKFNYKYFDTIETNAYDIHIYRNNDSKSDSVERVTVIVFRDYKLMKTFDNTISEYMNNKQCAVICASDCDNIYPLHLRDSIDKDARVYFASIYFFTKEYKEHIYYPKLEVVESNGARQMTRHCQAYLYAEQNMDAFRELILKRRTSIECAVYFTSGHKNPIMNVEQYYLTLIM